MAIDESASREVTILVVEDDDGHARLIERSLDRAGLNNPICRLDDGRRALEYIFREGEFAERERGRPLLILLDLDLPGVDGFGVLERMKSDDNAKRIPVIILSTTGHPNDIDRCYALGCNVYVVKPLSYERFNEAIRRLGLFLAVVEIAPDGARR